MTNEVIPTWTLGERLQKARVWAGIDAEDMAGLFFRHRNTISNWETGKTRPSARVLEKWSETTNVPRWWLLGEEPPESEPGSVDRRASRGATHGYPRRRLRRVVGDLAQLPIRHLQLADAV